MRGQDNHTGIPLVSPNIYIHTRPPVVHDWVNKGLDMSNRVCATGHIKDPVLFIEKSRHRVPVVVGFIHQVIIITGLNML